MKRVILLLTLWIYQAAHGEAFSSDCTPAEQKILQAPEIVAQLTRGSVVSKECAAIKGPSDRELLAIAMVGNVASGYESYITFFDRKGFSPAAKYEAKSQHLGFDLFPMLFNQKNRLIFIHPTSDKSRAVVYLNIQAAPATTRFSRWDYIFETKQFFEGPKIWMIEAGVLPKIYEDGPSLRALLGARSVEI